MPELNLKFKHHKPGEPIPGDPGEDIMVTNYLVYHPGIREYFIVWRSPNYRNTLIGDTSLTFGPRSDFWYAELDQLEVPAV